ncbi:MAG TPA: phospho-sugar mutase [Pirellulales bacterium]|nr:phospho-sugar mutase [Pirellulales bacterium]
MSLSTMSFDFDVALRELDAAAAAGKVTPDAARSIREWLTEPRYADYAPEVARQIAAGLWKQLDDVFWTVIPFGTGGRRGKMYPIGSNAINDRTIGESAQGLADYVHSQFPRGMDLSCAIAYDTRHQSRHFAELCSEIMAAAGFKVWFLDGYRSTPELSFTVRYKHCTCGIMVTASHNPPSDNAVKVYWSNGGQVLPPHDAGIIDRVMNCDEIHRRPFAEALEAGKIEYCQQEVDGAFIRAVHKQALPGPRTLKILYSPLHGVGCSAVLPALEADGFTGIEVFGPHSTPDGDFPNVPGHVANPENPAVFDSIIVRGKEIGADLILASDPDSDRLGCAAPQTMADGSLWKTFTGNQIAALLADYLLEARQRQGTLSPEHYVVKTLVTTEMVRRIADSYGVRTLGNLQVGCKWIAQTMDEEGTERFVLGCEESHGYIVGDHVRDKDAAVAGMLLAELAATVKQRGQTLHTKIDSLYWQFGYHAEQQVSFAMPGSQGMKDMQAVMSRIRRDLPAALAGTRVVRSRDYQSLTMCAPGGTAQPLVGPKGDMVILDLETEGNYVAIRPSGTEPKIKLYLFAFEPPELIADLEDTKAQIGERLKRLQAAFAALAKPKS